MENETTNASASPELIRQTVAQVMKLTERPRLSLSRREAAKELSMCEASLDMLIQRRIVRATRKGRRVIISRAEVERVAAMSIDRIWPPKRDGKATRHFTPGSAKSTTPESPKTRATR